MANEKYNGWTNWETWCVNLWLDNSEGDQEYLRDMARQAIEDSEDPDDKDAADRDARDTLADRIEAYVTEAYEELVGNRCDMFTDLLTGSLNTVDWAEIAAAVIDGLD